MEALLKRDRWVVLLCLAGLCLLAWLYLFHFAAEMGSMEMAPDAGGMAGMEGMDMPSMEMSGTSPPGRPIQDFALLAAMWIVMMVGMMLPAAAPTILLFAALERKRPEGPGRGRVPLFVGGYFLAWGAFSLAAATAQTGLAQSGLLSGGMALTSGLAAGSVFILAGIYEFTPLKHRCLTHCRSPLNWIPQHMKPGTAGALRMGAEHGAYCLGCCWALMLLLFAVGIMNLLWVAAIAAVVLVQKLFPGGATVARIGGAALIAWGIVLLAQPLLA
jgi:predicted metal-binding membrane protein